MILATFRLSWIDFVLLNCLSYRPAIPELWFWTCWVCASAWEGHRLRECRSMGHKQGGGRNRLLSEQLWQAHLHSISTTHHGGRSHTSACSCWINSCADWRVSAGDTVFHKEGGSATVKTVLTQRWWSDDEHYMNISCEVKPQVHGPCRVISSLPVH